MINNLFSTPVYYTSIDEVITKRLQTDITKYIKDNDDLFKTNVWKCNTRTNIFCEDSREFFPQYLKDTIFKHTSEYMVECGFKPKPFFVEDCWITLGGEGAYQELHDHIGAGSATNGFSAVLYVSIDKDKGGEFVMESPIDVLAKLLPESENELLAPQIHIEPQEGMMISFPSWLKHGSLQYKSADKKRISISWNINFN
tara:strand:- start:1391 stop:1987 length:597 start_codon:yes stop_codon:yes gene_type:complete